jgi:hypothetical protein
MPCGASHYAQTTAGLALLAVSLLSFTGGRLDAARLHRSDVGLVRVSAPVVTDVRAATEEAAALGTALNNSAAQCGTDSSDESGHASLSEAIRPHNQFGSMA